MPQLFKFLDVFFKLYNTITWLGAAQIMPWLAIDDGQTAPKLKEGDRCTVEQVKLGEHKTCAPDYLTESELITLMEQHGIGTDASIPTHINNIGQRNYVTVISGRRLQPTSLGKLAPD